MNKQDKERIRKEYELFIEEEKYWNGYAKRMENLGLFILLFSIGMVLLITTISIIITLK